jgi:hypothetical protein
MPEEKNKKEGSFVEELFKIQGKNDITIKTI